MKALVLALGLLVSVSSYADSNCEEVVILAEFAMSGKVMGNSAMETHEEFMESVKKNVEDEDERKRWNKNFLLFLEDAYKQNTSHLYTNKSKLQFVKDYGSGFYLACMAD